ncbi:hypothetical protein BOTBODRAFT_121258, partial [Botryobasidium botryosum FD-172 SS1]
DSRDIVLCRREGPLQHMNNGHPAYATLHYVLLSPRGKDGWSWELSLHETGLGTASPGDSGSILRASTAYARR